MAAVAVSTHPGKSASPGFILSRSRLPDNDEPYTVRKLCAATEEEKKWFQFTVWSAANGTSVETGAEDG